MKQIPLTKGQVALVDDEDYEWLMQWKWFAHDGRCGYYATRMQKLPRKGMATRRIMIFMHRLIMVVERSDEFVDHKNHNTLDNRRCNLRVCTQAENSRNRRPLPKCTSKYLGVSWYRRYSKWQAKIALNGRAIHLGYHNNEIDAARAYNEAAKKYHGEFANLNVLTEPKQLELPL